MTPDADMPTLGSMLETFELENVVPQAARLNGGPWERIEQHVRDIAAASDVYVLTGPLFDGPPHATGVNGVVIPTATWKVAVIGDTGAACGWICTNDQAATCSVVPVSYLNRGLGIDLFPVRPPTSEAWQECPAG